MTQLRFAPIIRVSTESQADDIKESLRVQTTKIQGYVTTLGGTIYREYKGQESAMPGSDRKIFDRLIEDSEMDLFDAVIVTDADRFSRDNGMANTCIERWKQLGIRFFEGLMEIDLFNDSQEYNLKHSVLQGEYHVKKQARKSLEARIHKAERGCPTSGSLPYGRDFDKKTETWTTDPDKKRLIERCADRYIQGEPLHQIAESVNMDRFSLREILNKKSGPEWVVHFNSKLLNIKKTVTIKHNQPMLDAETIRAVKEKCEANKTYTHGEIKNRYLLSRMIFCARCGYSMYGYTNAQGRQYYRHYHEPSPKNPCRLGKLIPANELGNSVLIHLVQTLGDPLKIQNAVERATPDIKKRQELTQDIEAFEKTLSTVDSEIRNLVKAVAKGQLTDGEVEKEINLLRERKHTIEDQLSLKQSELNSQPDPARVQQLSKLAKAVLSDATRNPRSILNKPYENKKELVQRAFAGKDSQGQRLGVYIDYTGRKDQPWQIEIRGTLENTLLALPLSDEYLSTVFHLDSDVCDVSEELQKIRNNITKAGRLMPGLPHENSYHTLYC